MTIAYRAKGIAAQRGEDVSPMPCTVTIHGDLSCFPTYDRGKSRNGRDVACVLGIPVTLASDWSTGCGFLFSRFESKGRRFGNPFVRRLDEAAENFPGFQSVIEHYWRLEQSAKRAQPRKGKGDTVIASGLGDILLPSQLLGGIGYLAAIEYILTASSTDGTLSAYFDELGFDGDKLPTINVERHGEGACLPSLWESFIRRLVWGGYNPTLSLVGKDKSEDGSEYWTITLDDGTVKMVSLDDIASNVDSVPTDFAAIRDKWHEGTDRGAATKVGIDSRIWLLVKAFKAWVTGDKCRLAWPKKEDIEENDDGKEGGKGGGMVRLGGYDLRERDRYAIDE